MIDKNGPPPLGTGIKQLRENIAESKLSYEIMDDAAQAFLKTKIMDNIQKYFYLICFTAYLREQSKTAKDGVSEEDKKAFALSGGKGEFPFPPPPPLSIKKIVKLNCEFKFDVSGSAGYIKKKLVKLNSEFMQQFNATYLQGQEK